jgi:hypothetical protein
MRSHHSGLQTVKWNLNIASDERIEIWLERFVASHQSYLLARRLESRAGRGGSQILLCKWKFSGRRTEQLHVHQTLSLLTMPKF